MCEAASRGPSALAGIFVSWNVQQQYATNRGVFYRVKLYTDFSAGAIGKLPYPPSFTFIQPSYIRKRIGESQHRYVINSDDNLFERHRNLVSFCPVIPEFTTLTGVYSRRRSSLELVHLHSLGGVTARPSELHALCIPVGSLNRVPALIGWGKGGNVTSAGWWQVTLCDPIWHVSSCTVLR